MYSFVKFVFNLFWHSESSTIQNWSTLQVEKPFSMQPVLCTVLLTPTLSFLAKRHAKVKNWKAINTARAHGASQLDWSRKGVPHSVHPNEIRRRNPPANMATNRKCTCWHARYALARTTDTEHQQPNMHVRQHEWYTATSPTNEHGRNSQAHHRGGVTQGPIASCGISVVRSGICHVAEERPSRRLYLSPAPSCPYRSPATTQTAYVMADSGDFTWYARSLGKSCGCAGLEDAELVPSDSSAVAAAKQSSATRRWVVRNLTWLAISKMLFDDEIALKWGVAYYLSKKFIIRYVFAWLDLCVMLVCQHSEVFF